MFNVWISMRRRISPFFEILRFVLDAIHLHVSSDGPLLLFQPLFLSGRQSIVSIFKCPLVRSKPRISVSYLLFELFG
jgi:hypothetical protein